MGVVTLSSQGKFENTERFFKKMLRFEIRAVLEEYGKKGVEALKYATPKDTGLTSESWYYKVHVSHKSASIEWFNSNINDGEPIAILIQYGHGTGWGGYVPPVDYINPALQPIFDEITSTVWTEVENA